MTFLAAHTIQELLMGLRMTVVLIAAAAPLGLFIGLVTAVAGCYAPLPVRWATHVYRSAFRGTPLLVQLFLLYYGLPRLGPVLSPLAAAILAFILCSGAYHAEYIRSALLSVPSSQLEAARALGLTRTAALLRVVFPQAMRRALPGCTNEIVYLVKYSSLAYLVTLVELTGAGRLIAYRTFRFFEVFLVVGMIYLLLVSLVAGAGGWLERRVAVHRPEEPRGAPTVPLGRPHVFAPSGNRKRHV